MSGSSTAHATPRAQTRATTARPSWAAPASTTARRRGRAGSASLRSASPAFVTALYHVVSRSHAEPSSTSECPF